MAIDVLCMIDDFAGIARLAKPFCHLGLQQLGIGHYRDFVQDKFLVLNLRIRVCVKTLP